MADEEDDEIDLDDDTYAAAEDFALDEEELSDEQPEPESRMTPDEPPR